MLVILILNFHLHKDVVLVMYHWRKSASFQPSHKAFIKAMTVGFVPPDYLLLVTQDGCRCGGVPYRGLCSGLGFSLLYKEPPWLASSTMFPQCLAPWYFVVGNHDQCSVCDHPLHTAWCVLWTGSLRFSWSLQCTNYHSHHKWFHKWHHFFELI